MSVARALRRSLFGGGKKSRTCPACGTAAYVTKDGNWYRHRMPPKCFGFNLPLLAGPICKASGKLVAAIPRPK